MFISNKYYYLFKGGVVGGGLVQGESKVAQMDFLGSILSYLECLLHTGNEGSLMLNAN